MLHVPDPANPCAMKKFVRRVLLLLAWTAGALAVTGIIGAFVAASAWDGYVRRAGGFDLAKVGEIPQRSAIHDVDGELLSYIHGENRIIAPLETVSPHFLKALLAREDARFYEHHGVDYRGIARAAWTNFRRGGIAQGASTITQQLARNSFDLGERSYSRKLLEAALAQRLEREFSKARILEFYVNRIYFGAGLYGIETAARAYFGRSASELDLSQAALLAGIIRSPNRLSPVSNIKGALAQRDVVLDRMAALGMISADEASRTKSANLFVSKKRPLPFQENYAMDAVRRDLELILSPDQIDQGGLRIYTTIDPALQKLAEHALEERLSEVEKTSGFKHPKKAGFTASSGSAEEGVAEEEEEKAKTEETGDREKTEKPTDYLQGALVAIDNRTGGIRAIVGGRDFAHSRYNRALLARRQAGSTFKPFIYAAAFERGLLPGTLVDDSEIRPGEFKNISHDWSPANSDGAYLGLQPAEAGLVRSRNTMTVRVGQALGVPEVRSLTNRLGLCDDAVELPVIFLGAFETTLKDLTAAYTAFPNHGARRQAHIISRIDDWTGRTIYKATLAEAPMFSEDAAWMTSGALQKTVQSGTAAKAKSLGLTKPAGGKTGTTNDYRDAWFVGYTTSLTCGVWVGFDKPQTIMEKGYGSALALPVWVSFIQNVPEKTYPAAKFKPRGTLRKTRLCAQSGALATAGCDEAGMSYDHELPPSRLPAGHCTAHRESTPAPLIADDFRPENEMPPPPGTAAPDPGSAAPGGSLPHSTTMNTRPAVAAAVPLTPPVARAVPVAPGSAAAPPQPRPPQETQEPASPVVVRPTERGMVIHHVPPVPPNANARAPMPERRAPRGRSASVNATDEMTAEQRGSREMDATIAVGEPAAPVKVLRAEAARPAPIPAEIDRPPSRNPVQASELATASESAPVPVARAVPANESAPQRQSQQQQQQSSPRRTDAISAPEVKEDDNDEDDEEKETVRSRSRSVGKGKRVIRTRVYPDGRREEEIIEMP